MSDDDLPEKVRGTYEQWLELYRSGQMPDEDFHARMREDEVFKRWVEKRLADEGRD